MECSPLCCWRIAGRSEPSPGRVCLLRWYVVLQKPSPVSLCPVKHGCAFSDQCLVVFEPRKVAGLPPPARPNLQRRSLVPPLPLFLQAIGRPNNEPVGGASFSDWLTDPQTGPGRSEHPGSRRRRDDPPERRYAPAQSSAPRPQPSQSRRPLPYLPRKRQPTPCEEHWKEPDRAARRCLKNRPSR